MWVNKQGNIAATLTAFEKRITELELQLKELKNEPREPEKSTGPGNRRRYRLRSERDNGVQNEGPGVLS